MGRFMNAQDLNLSWAQRVGVLRRLLWASIRVESPHTMDEILSYVMHILRLPKSREGVLVEAGCFKGSSSVKFSIAAKLAGRQLVIFDSFKGIPPNNEDHGTNIFGGEAGFAQGDWAGSINEVKSNIKNYGEIDCCTFVEGYFENSMPSFKTKVAAAYIDVDLVSSTETCLEYLYPLMEKGGSIFSQDGHLPLVINLLDDATFWKNRIGVSKPQINGLRSSKLVEIITH
jgi:O-methyltransferase